MRHSVITFAHNQAHQILEWVSHYKTLGDLDLVVISYPSEDDTDQMLSILHEHGHLTHIPLDVYSNATATPEYAISTATQTLQLTAADWALCLDLDDYLIIHRDGGILPDLTAHIPVHTGLALSRRYFGNNGLVGPSPNPVFQTHLRGAPTLLNGPTPSRLPAYLHRVGDRMPDVWLDGSGHPLKHRQRARVLNTDRFAWAQINSYPLRSIYDFLIDLATNSPKAQHILDPLTYWIDHNFNFENVSDQTDTTKMTQNLSQLRAVPGIQDCENNSHQWRNAILREILQHDQITNLAQRLFMLLPTQPMTGFHVQMIKRLKTT